MVPKKKPLKPLLPSLCGKRAISIRLDIAILDFFKASGPRWQSRMNDVLKKYVERRK